MGIGKTALLVAAIAGAYYVGKVRNEPTIDECVKVVQESAPYQKSTQPQNVGRVATVNDVEFSYTVTPQGQVPTLQDRVTGAKYDVHVLDATGSRTLDVYIRQSVAEQPQQQSVLTPQTTPTSQAPQTPQQQGVQQGVAGGTLDRAVSGYNALRQDVKSLIKGGP